MWTQRHSATGTVSSAAAADPLRAVLQPGLLARLDRLRIGLHPETGVRPGGTPVRRGVQDSGVEIARHKPYVAGDDLRHLDWSAYGRLDELLVKKFRAERESPLTVFLDTSASMAVPLGDGKFNFSRGLATAFAYVALRHYDPVRIVALTGGASAYRATPLLGHPHRLADLSEFLGVLTPAGAVRLDLSLAAALRTYRLSGAAVVISDFLAPSETWLRAIDLLNGCGCKVGAVRVLGPEERSGEQLPAVARLIDSETRRERLVALTPRHRSLYREGVAKHLDELRTACQSRGSLFAVADPAGGIENALFRELPVAGLLR